MKRLPIFLGLSLLANAAFFFVGLPALRDNTSTPFSAPTHAAPSATSASATSPRPHATPASSIWETLRAGDPAALAQLRAAGWPEDILRVIVVILVDDLFREREAALRYDDRWGSVEYWKERSFGQNQKVLHLVLKEKLTLPKTILGSDYRREHNPADLRYAGLSPEKAAAVAAIIDDYYSLLSDVQNDMGFVGITFPEDREKRAFLTKEQRADLVRTLTPEELLEYDLRNSNTAASMRVNMEAFEPTEQEFRALFLLKFASDERLLRVLATTDPKAATEVRIKAQTEVEAQTRQLLGDQRYAELERSRDAEYRRLYQLGQFLQLPPAAAIAAYDIRADIDKRARALTIPPDADADMRAGHQAARAALADEAEARLGATLGQRGLEVFHASSPFIKSLRTPLPAPKKERAPRAP